MDPDTSNVDGQRAGSSSASRSSSGYDGSSSGHDAGSVAMDGRRASSSSSASRSNNGGDGRMAVDGSSSSSSVFHSRRVLNSVNPGENIPHITDDNRDTTTRGRPFKRIAPDDNETIDNIEVDATHNEMELVNSRDEEVPRNRLEASRRDAVRFYHLSPGRDLNITSAILKERRRELSRRMRRRVTNINNGDDLVQQNIENSNTANVVPAGANAHYNVYLENQEGIIDIEDFIRLLGTNINAHVDNNIATHVVDEDFNALLDDVSNNNIEAVKQYIEAGYDLNKSNHKGHTLLSTAALKCNTAIMEILIAAGASINAVNKTGSTVLIQAAHFGHVQAVRLLLENHACCDIVNKNGTSALMRASQEGQVEIAKMLLGANADVNRKNIEGMSALMLASQRNHAEVVSLLIQAGAFCDDQTVQGSTALMLASKRGHVACVDVLITMGAEVYILDSRDRTARDSALRKNFLTILPYLDTQFQINRMRHRICIQRSNFIVECRNAYIKGKLQLRYEPNVSSKAMTSSHFIAFNPSDSLSCLRKTSSDVVCELRATGGVNSYSTIDTLLRLKASVWSNTRQRFECDDHQWPLLLIKCMALPNGVFDLINDFLPLPRMWEWSLKRLKQRCKLAPRQAIVDLSIISDEILADCCIFSSLSQEMLPIRISRNPLVYRELQLTNNMPVSVLEIIDYIADIQAILSRTLDSDITFKPQLAKKLLSHVTTLYKWYSKDNYVDEVFGISDDAINTLGMSGLDTETEMDAPDLDDDESDVSNNE